MPTSVVEEPLADGFHLGIVNLGAIANELKIDKVMRPFAPRLGNGMKFLRNLVGKLHDWERLGLREREFLEDLGEIGRQRCLEFVRIADLMWPISMRIVCHGRPQ